jgi:hypothetical protein
MLVLALPPVIRHGFNLRDMVTFCECELVILGCLVAVKNAKDGTED